MDRDKLKHDLTVGVILLCLGGLLSGLIWLFVPQSRDWWFNLFHTIGGLITGGWSWLWGGVEIPRIVVGVVAILGLMYVGGGGRLEALLKRVWALQDELHKRNVDLRQRILDEPIAAPTAEPAPAPVARPKKEPPPLSDDELTILKIMADLDGYKPKIEELTEWSGFSQVRAQYAADALIGRRFLKRMGFVVYSEHGRYDLDAKGRAYCINAGWSK